MANCKSSRNCSFRYSIICAVLVLKFCSKSSDRSCCPLIGQNATPTNFSIFFGKADLEQWYLLNGVSAGGGAA